MLKSPGTMLKILIFSLEINRIDEQKDKNQNYA